LPLWFVQQAIGCHYEVIADLVIAGIDVDGDDLIDIVLCLHFLSEVGFIKLMPNTTKFITGITETWHFSILLTSSL